MSNEVKIKKVAAYPIEAELEVGAQKIPGQIVKLTLVGFLIKMPAVLKVGSTMKVHFKLPVIGDQIFWNVKVIKTYDQYRGHKPQETEAFVKADTESEEAPASTGSAYPHHVSTHEEEKTPAATKKSAASRAERLAELHFIGLPEVQREKLESFLKTIGQTQSH